MLDFPKTSFHTFKSRNLLVTNSLFQALDFAERRRANFEDSYDFAIRRFAFLFDFVASKREFDEEKLERVFNKKNISDNDVSKNYKSLLNNLQMHKEQEILKLVFAGYSNDEIQMKLDLSFDELIRSLQKIEAQIKIDSKLEFKRFKSSKKDDEEKLSEKRRQALTLFAASYNLAEMSEILTRKKNLLTNDIRYGLDALSLSRSSIDREMAMKPTLNLDDKEQVVDDRLFFMLDAQIRRGVLADNANDLKASYKLVKRFFVFLTDMQRTVLEKRLVGFSETETTKLLKLKKSNRTDSYFQEAKKMLNRMIKAYLREKDSVPEGIDPIDIMLLTPHEDFALRKYVKGESKEVIQKKLKASKVTEVDRLLRNARAKLKIKQSFIDGLRQKNLDQLKDPDKDLILLVFPGYVDNYDSFDSKTIKHLKNIIGLIKTQLKAAGFATAYFDDYVSGMKYFEIAKKHNVNLKTVSKSIKKQIAKYEQAFISSVQYPAPKNIDKDKWFLVEALNKAIYLLYRDGRSNEEIVKELDLNIKPRSITPRIKRLERDCLINQNA
jgi:transposase